MTDMTEFQNATVVTATEQQVTQAQPMIVQAGSATQPQVGLRFLYFGYL